MNSNICRFSKTDVSALESKRRCQWRSAYFKIGLDVCFAPIFFENAKVRREDEDHSIIDILLVPRFLLRRLHKHAMKRRSAMFTD